MYTQLNRKTLWQIKSTKNVALQQNSNGLISQFLSHTCTEVSGVENIGQCGRLSQLSWLLGAV